MNYLIDKHIIFIPEENVLRSISDARQEASLPRPATLLLLTLINAPATLISREALMEEAWDRHGFRASGHNLNTYLSVLRHALNELGADNDLIKTLPRQGLIMRDVTIALEAEDALPEATGAPNAFSPAPAAATSGAAPRPDPAPEAAAAASHPVRRVVDKKLALTGSLLLAAALCVLFLLPSTTPLTLPELRRWPAGQYAQCPIYTLQPVAPSQLAELRRFIVSNDKAGRCQQTGYQIYVALQEKEGTPVSSIAFCQLSGEHFTACTTLYQEGKPWQS